MQQNNIFRLFIAAMLGLSIQITAADPVPDVYNGCWEAIYKGLRPDLSIIERKYINITNEPTDEIRFVELQNGGQIYHTMRVIDGNTTTLPGTMRAIKNTATDYLLEQDKFYIENNELKRESLFVDSANKENSSHIGFFKFTYQIIDENHLTENVHGIYLADDINNPTPVDYSASMKRLTNDEAECYHSWPNTRKMM